MRRYEPPTKHVHSGQLARWLGEDAVERVSLAMRDFYWPIALSGVPGNVWAQPGGDFTGQLRAGFEASAMDRAMHWVARFKRGYIRASRKRGQLNAGFTSLSDLINEVTVNSKRQEPYFYKVGTTGVLAATNSLFRCAGHPGAGAAGSAAPGGVAPTSATTGGLIFTNPSGGDTTHITSGFPLGSVISNSLLMYDRIFAVAKTMNSSATEAVTGVPTRYQSATATDAEFAGGNFVFPETGTVLANTAHNWTVCQYTDQGGTTGVSLPSVTGNAANIANRLDIPVGAFFCPLATGDTGIKALTQMQCSATVATGTIDWVIGHPLMWMPLPIAGVICVADNLNTAFNFTRIIDSACLAFLEVCKPATTATSYTGTIVLAQG